MKCQPVQYWLPYPLKQNIYENCTKCYFKNYCHIDTGIINSKLLKKEYMILNIENWQKPDTVPYIEVQVQEKKESSVKNEVQPTKLICWNCPEMRYNMWLSSYNSLIEQPLNEMEKIVNKWNTFSPFERYDAINEYAKLAEYYNLLAGFECMETDLLKVNKPLTKQPSQIVVNL